jgi:hypothetical protein
MSSSISTHPQTYSRLIVRAPAPAAIPTDSGVSRAPNEPLRPSRYNPAGTWKGSQIDRVGTEKDPDPLQVRQYLAFGRINPYFSEVDLHSIPFRLSGRTGPSRGEGLRFLPAAEPRES